jgi:hypothetical protein
MKLKKNQLQKRTQEKLESTRQTPKTSDLSHEIG